MRVSPVLRGGRGLQHTMSMLSIERISPQAGIRGGRVKVYGSGLDVQALAECCLLFGTNVTRPGLITPTLVLGVVPAEATPQTLQLMQNGRTSNAVPFAVGTLLAENLHLVASPAIDRTGTIYTTISGTKGQRAPVSLYKVTRFGDVEPFAAGIANPTGLAFGPDGLLYVSSRHESAVYRVDAAGNVARFADGLGIATGLAFDRFGRLYVGDRRGTVYRLTETGNAQVFAKLSRSVTGYHLACDAADRLYVSYPTFAGTDQVYRIDQDGAVHVLASGLGRAQGIAIDGEQNLYVVAYLAGEGGVVKITPDGTMQQVIAGMNLVGLAFGLDGELVLADNSAVYKLDFGVQGRLLP
jgi:sugar lactone lactonase YvrE